MVGGYNNKSFVGMLFIKLVSNTDGIVKVFNLGKCGGCIVGMSGIPSTIRKNPFDKSLERKFIPARVISVKVRSPFSRSMA